MRTWSDTVPFSTRDTAGNRILGYNGKDCEKLIIGMKCYRKGKIPEDITWFYSHSVRGGVQDGTDLAWYIGERALNVLAEV